MSPLSRMLSTVPCQTLTDTYLAYSAAFKLLPYKNLTSHQLCSKISDKNVVITIFRYVITIFHACYAISERNILRVRRETFFLRYSVYMHVCTLNLRYQYEQGTCHRSPPLGYPRIYRNWYRCWMRQTAL